MSNFVFYDFETSSSNKYWGQIIQIGAILTNDNLEELDPTKIEQDLKKFNDGGYKFDSAASEENDLVFKANN